MAGWIYRFINVCIIIQILFFSLSSSGLFLWSSESHGCDVGFGKKNKLCVGNEHLMCFNTFTFMHLADAFIQSDLHCIQAIHFIYQYACVPMCVLSILNSETLVIFNTI